MTFTAVSTLVDTTTTTLAVNPARTGNFYLAEIITTSATVYCNSISGGNCTWTLLTSFKGHNNTAYASVFLGTATATGSANATLAFTGSTSGITVEAVAQQFSSSAGSYALVTSGVLDLVTGTNTWPSLIPGGSGDLYFGFFYNSGTAVNGSTTGFTYTNYLGDGVAYNPGCGSSAVAPVWGDSGSYFGIAVMLAETPSTSLSRPVQAKIPKQKKFPAGLIYGSAVEQLADLYGDTYSNYYGIPQYSPSYSTGRISANYGSTPENPTPGPVFRQATAPARIRVTLPPRGRAASSRSNPVHNPTTGPVFRQAVHPARAVIPQVFSRGRVAGNPGIAVPVPGTPGPVFRQKTYPARIRVTLPPRGRAAGNPGAPLRNPTQGPVFTQAVHPIRAVIPQTFSKGRVGSNPGSLPPVQKAFLPVGLTLTAGNITGGWQYTGPVPLTYPQYLQPGGDLVVNPGEIVNLMGPASGWQYDLTVPPPDGRWVILGGGGDIYGTAEEKAPAKKRPWPAHLPLPFAVIADRIRRRQRREGGTP